MEQTPESGFLVVAAFYWMKGNWGFLTSLFQGVCACVQKTSHFLCGSQVLPPLFLFHFEHFSACVTGRSLSQTWKHKYT